MFNVILAGGHLYGKQLFTWLSLVVSLMASFVLSFFPLDVLDEIWDLFESVSEGFLTYSCSFSYLHAIVLFFIFACDEKFHLNIKTMHLTVRFCLCIMNSPRSKYIIKFSVMVFDSQICSPNTIPQARSC